VVTSLIDWIDQLKSAEFDVFALKQLINKSDDSPLEMHHIPSLQIKYKKPQCRNLQKTC